MDINKKLLREIRELFKINPAQTIVEAILSGDSGEIFMIYNIDRLVSAALKLGDFFLIEGELTGGEGYMEMLQPHYEVISSNVRWYEFINLNWGDSIKNKRTILNYNDLDKENINKILKNIPEGCYLQRINVNMAKKLLKEKWSRDLVSNFDSPEAFEENGIGFVLLSGLKVVAGASSFSLLKDGIEVEVDVNPFYRKNGYGTIVSAALVDYCIKMNLIPHWDAMNMPSVKIAKKLGYVEDSIYETLILE